MKAGAFLAPVTFSEVESERALAPEFDLAGFQRVIAAYDLELAVIHHILQRFALSGKAF